MEGGSSAAKSTVDSENISNAPPEVSNPNASIEVDDVDDDGTGEEEGGSLRSPIWVHFSRFFSKKDKIYKAKCKHCDTVLKGGGRRYGTKGLWNHYEKCKKAPHNIATNQARLNMQRPLFDSTGQNEIVPFNPLWKYDEKAARKALALMFICDECPFKHVEHDGFRYLMSVVCPQLLLPSRKTLGKDCYKIYEEERIKLKAFLKQTTQRISFTTDTWTSIQRVNYMCLTAHFVDNQWKLQKRILNFCPILSHKGDEIGKAIEKCIKKWGIENIFTVTVDNASANTVAIDYLKKRMDVWKTSILGNKYVHMKCVAHIFNLIVQDGLKEREEGDAISAIRGAVRYIKSSPSRLQAFKGCVASEALDTKKLLCLDVPTRWNSTCLMLETALLLKNAINSFFDSNDSYRKDMSQVHFNGVPTEYHWERCERLVTFLSCFLMTTKNVSKSLHVTSHSVFHEITVVLLEIREALAKKDDDPVLFKMGVKMQEKFDKYWGALRDTNYILYYDVVLDPHHKFTLINYSFDDMYDDKTSTIMKNAVKDGLFAMFEDYKVRYGIDATPSTSTTSSHAKPPLSEPAAKRPRVTYKSNLKKLKSVVEGSENVKSELERYLAEDVDPEGDDEDSFDILNWWKVNSLRFPILARVARDVLGVPVSTVASESAFSTGGRVLDAFRSSLLPKIVEALICTQDWVRRSSAPVTIEEDVEEIGELEEEWARGAVESCGENSPMRDE